MNEMDRIIVTGNVNDNCLVLILNLTEGYDYRCEKALWLGVQNHSMLHSIIYDEDIIYMTDSHNNKLYKYNLKKNTISETTIGRDPRHVCIFENKIYVTNFESDNISIINKENLTLEGSIPASMKPHDVVYCEENNKLYITCYEENHIMEYDFVSGNKKYYETDGKPMHLFVDEEYIYTMTYFVNGSIYSKINFIDRTSNKIKNIVKIKGLSSNMCYDKEKNNLYIINIDDRNIYVIDTNTRAITKKIYVGGYPEEISFGKSNIYITNSKKNQITVIDRQKQEFIKNIHLGFSPICIKTL